MNLHTLSDSQLYTQCRTYGANARLWMRKFQGLLPEVYRRRLYKRRGYASIEEFAAKLAGMSHDVTQRVLRVHKKLEDKPILRQQFETGACGLAKTEIVAYVATKETEKEWAKKVNILPKAVLQAYVQQIRLESTAGGNPEPEKVTMTIQVSPEVEKELRLFKQKLEKEKKETLDWNVVLKTLLDRERGREEPVGARTETPVPAPTQKEAAAHTRYIPQKIQRFIKQQYGGLCAFPGCRKPKEFFHHTKRFALTKTHDPNHLIPLCKTHNSLAHAGLIANEEEHPSQWKLRKQPDETSSKHLIDRLVWKFSTASST